jgi:glycosyltransferase involved in cell wall biosynthesis
MRILYHHRSLGDGAEGIHIHEMIAAFRRLGHHVELISLARPSGAGRGDRGLAATARHRLPGVIAEAARLATNAPDYFVVRRALRRSQADVIYKRHALYDVATTVEAARTHVPLVLEVNTLYSLPVVRQFEPLRLVGLAAALEQRALRSARFVVAVSTPLKDRIVELAGPEVQVLVLPNGVNAETFDPASVDGHEVRKEYGLTDRFVVGWTGVLRAWHGVELLLDALRRVPEAELLVVGDGPERSTLQRFAEQFGLTERVHITGRVDHNDVPRYIAAFDVAVASGDHTGFASPMKVVEYMALARAVVVPRQPNFSDLVRDHETGLQFTPGNAVDLADRILELSASRPLRERLGRAARAVVCERLNWTANARAVMCALEERRGETRRAS